jgi:hypothetical protein
MKKAKEKGLVPVISVKDPHTFKKLSYPLKILFDVAFESDELNNEWESPTENKSILMDPKRLIFILLAYVPGQTVEDGNFSKQNSIQLKATLIKNTQHFSRKLFVGDLFQCKPLSSVKSQN